MAMKTSFNLTILEAKATRLLCHFRKSLEIKEVHSSNKTLLGRGKKVQHSK